MRYIPFSRLISLTLVAGLVTVVLVGIDSYRTIKSLELENTSVTSRELEASDKVITQFDGLESSYYEYLLTAESAELAEFGDKARDLRAAMGALDRAFASSRMREAVAAIEDLLGRRLAGMEEAASARRSGLETARRVDGATRGLDARIDRGMDELRVTESRRLADEHAETVRRAHASGRAVAIGTVVSALLLVFAMVVVRRYQLRRERAEARLRRSESQLRDITDAVPALIGQFDTDCRFLFHNRAYEEFFGLPGDRIHGRTLQEVLGPERYRGIGAKVEEALAGYPVRFECEHTMPDGSRRDVSVHYFPNYDEESGSARAIGFYSLATDITDLKRIDRMKTEFVSTVSHELRTPLTSIRGSLGLMAGGVGGPLPDAAKRLVEIAKNNCERLIRLINDILDIEKIESGKLQMHLKRIELGPFLAAALQANEGFAAQHGVRLELDAPSEPLLVDADSDRLEQVLANLLSNAVKFSPSGSAVGVRLSRSGTRVRVDVRDSGPGIPAEFRERIFQKFSQADASDSRRKGGTGLGLNISKAIVERLGGTIGFTTAPGQGTTFHFELPCAPSVPDAERPAAAAAPAVLVCEDDPDIGRLIAMMLEKAGFAAEVSGTAAHARSRLAERPFAAMTVDLRLPDEDGISLIRSLRQVPALAKLPIVVVSASAGEGRIQVNSEDLSVSDWLAKPIDENRLVGAIRDATDGQRQRARVLHVEDDPDIRSVAAAVAQDLALFDFAGTVAEARERLRASRFDVVLLDLELPDGSGWALLSDLEAMAVRPRIVVFSVNEVSSEQAARVDAVLVKSRSTNEELVAALRGVLAEAPVGEV